MTIQEVYKNYVEKISKDFLNSQTDERARKIAEVNNRFYGKVNELISPNSIKEEAVLEV